MHPDPEEFDKAIDEFVQRFKGRLGARGGTMQIMAEYYLHHAEERPFIIETGTARDRGNYAGDGQSTLIWDFLTQFAEHGGVMSVDKSPDAIATAKPQCSDRVNFICSDSVYALCNTDPDLLAMTGLLYLDSFDLDLENPWPAAMHHMKELAAVWARLPDGCIIAVDDCVNDQIGKHILVKDFMAHTDAKCIFQGGQTIWIKQ